MSIYPGLDPYGSVATANTTAVVAALAQTEYEEKCRAYEAEIKRLKMDMSSLQASANNLRDKVKDEQQRVLDKTLLLNEFEGKVKQYDLLKVNFLDLSNESASLRVSLADTQERLDCAEKRAQEAESLLDIKESVIDKQTIFMKELQVKNRRHAEAETRAHDKAAELQRLLDEKAQEASDASENAYNALKRVSELQSELLEKSARLEAQMMSSSATLLGGFGSPQVAHDKKTDITDDDRLGYFTIELDKARKRVGELTASLTKLGDQAAETRRRTATLEKENARMLEQVDLAQRETALAQNALRSVETEAELTRREIEMAREEVQKSRSQIEPLRTRLNEVEVELREKTAELAKKDFSTATAAIPIVMPPQYSSSDEVGCMSALADKLRQQETQLNDLRTLLTFREDCILKINDQKEMMKRELQLATEERNNLRAQVQPLAEKINDANKKLAQANEDLLSTKKRKEKEIERRRAAQSKTDELTLENEQQKSRITALEERIVKFSAVTSEAKRELIAREELIDKLQQEIKTVQEQLSLERSQLTELRIRQQESETKVAQLMSELENAPAKSVHVPQQETETKIAESTSELAQVYEQLSLERAQLTELRIRQQESETKVAQLTSELENAPAKAVHVSQQETETKVAELTSELAQVYEQLSLERNQLTELRIRQQESETKVAQLTSEHEESAKPKSSAVLLTQLTALRQTLEERSSAAALNENTDSSITEEVASPIRGRGRGRGRGRNAAKRLRSESDETADMSSISCAVCIQVKRQLIALEQEHSSS